MRKEVDDLSSWLGKPPQKLHNIVNDDFAAALSDINVSDQSPAASEATNSSKQTSWEAVMEATPAGATLQEEEEDSYMPQPSDDDTIMVAARMKPQNFYVEVPHISDEQEYEYLPGHFTVHRVVNEYKDGKFLVKLRSGEANLLTTNQLLKLDNGLLALDSHRRKTMARGRRNAHKPQALGMIDWTSLELGSSGEASSDEGDRRTRKRDKQSSPDNGDFKSEPELPTSDEDGTMSDASEKNDRRSLRQREKKLRTYFREGQDLSDGSDQPQRRILPNRSRRETTREKRSGYPQKTGFRPSKSARRSSRTRNLPRRSMRERQEDEISAHSEEDIGPKVVATKEVFPTLAENDPFRRRHRPECENCGRQGGTADRGELVYCQGCSNSHHRLCLGNRGSREHLVTKVGEGNFVLQCRRCIGIAHSKDRTAPHLGHCEVCKDPGPLAKPLRSRLTTKQEQRQREENGGRDPITIVDSELINNVKNVLFRCWSCARAWHMHHLPTRNQEEVEEDNLTQEELAKRRFDYYHRSWECKDCIEHKIQLDTIVAWRPADLESYIPGYTVAMMEESKKEYLVKWQKESYFRTTWMPGSWVWGTAPGNMRVAFMKKQENDLPKMSTKDAIPEDFFRIDIVFDVRYSSIVKNSTMEIELLRGKEVDKAFVKYKGLGYEDSIWEEPPKWTDTERWKDYHDAYEEYVMRRHTDIPPQTTLRRHLTAIRQQDFGTTLAKKTQPSVVVGGEMMLYQLEGLNWLYYQWFINHNAILADEMGLGKTIQLIAFFATMVQDHKCWPFLVVVPNSTCPNWRREIRKWVPSLRVVTYYGTAHARKLAHDLELFPKTEEDREKEKNDKALKKSSQPKNIKAHIVVASYESIVEEKTRQSLMRVPWQGLVVDEGQRLKNDKNLLYEALSKFKFPFRVLLTGTPLQNNARELFNLLQFLDPKISAAHLEAKYETLTKENVPELHELMRPFFLRRTKVQVLTFLPPMAQIILPVTMSTVQKKLYKSILAKNPQLMKSIFNRDGPVATKDRHNLNNILMQLRKCLCHPFVYSRQIEERTYETSVSFRNLVEAGSKLQLLSIMLPKLQDRGHRVLIFSQFLDNLDIIEDFLDGLGLQHRRLDGSINSLEKQRRIDEFNAPDSPYFAFLLSTRSGGVGINLATADTVIIMDPDFNPHQDIQALSRAHRIGQKSKVLVFQIMTRGSVEEKIMQIGKKKMALDHVLIQEMDREDEAGMDLESILRHGAEALFDNDNTGDIIYDSASVDRLLDRSQIEDTSTGEDKSAESQFSFARIWANDKATLEEGLQDSGTSTRNPGIWDKILQERERAFAEEAARNRETLGRGKRKRQLVDYQGQDGLGGELLSSPRKGPGHEASDTDFQAQPIESESETTPGEESEFDVRNEVDIIPQFKRPTIKARPFSRVKVPSGPAPHFNGDGPSDYIPMGGLPPSHQCAACHELHPMGWCRLKIAGIEHCNLCGLAHLGYTASCPHLNNEAQVVTLLRTLKESTEDRDLIELATRYLRGVRGELVQHRRATEEKASKGTIGRKSEGQKLQEMAARMPKVAGAGDGPGCGSGSGSGNGN